MQNNQLHNFIPVEQITNQIYFIRGQYVLLDQDLADLYDLETKHPIQAVKRNKERLSDDFMFQSSTTDFENLRSQIVTSKRGGRRYLPYVFTEQGVAMLSSVLNSYRAIHVNIAIMRTFVQLRKLTYNYADLKHKIESIERKYDIQFRLYIRNQEKHHKGLSFNEEYRNLKQNLIPYRMGDI
jgi:hypothetical protein